MIIFRVKNANGTLTYTYNGDNYVEGYTTFVNAMKLQFKDHSLRTTLTAMNDLGNFYYPEKNRYLTTDYPKESYTIILSEGKDN